MTINVTIIILLLLLFINQVRTQRFIHAFPPSPILPPKQTVLFLFLLLFLPVRSSAKFDERFARHQTTFSHCTIDVLIDQTRLIFLLQFSSGGPPPQANPLELKPFGRKPLTCTPGFPPLGTPSGRERRGDLGTRGGKTLAVAPTTSRD